MSDTQEYMNLYENLDYSTVKIEGSGSGGGFTPLAEGFHEFVVTKQESRVVGEKPVVNLSCTALKNGEATDKWASYTLWLPFPEGEEKVVSKRSMDDARLVLSRIGYGEFYYPQWNAEEKIFTSPTGESMSTEEAAEAKAEVVKRTMKACSELFRGETSLADMTFFGEVIHREYNGKTYANIKRVYKTLPEGVDLADIE